MPVLSLEFLEVDLYNKNPYSYSPLIPSPLLLISCVFSLHLIYLLLWAFLEVLLHSLITCTFAFTVCTFSLVLTVPFAVELFFFSSALLYFSCSNFFLPFYFSFNFAVSICLICNLFLNGYYCCYYYSLLYPSFPAPPWFSRMLWPSIQLVPCGHIFFSGKCVGNRRRR